MDLQMVLAERETLERELLLPGVTHLSVECDVPRPPALLVLVLFGDRTILVIRRLRSPPVVEHLADERDALVDPIWCLNSVPDLNYWRLYNHALVIHDVLELEGASLPIFLVLTVVFIIDFVHHGQIQDAAESLGNSINVEQIRDLIAEANKGGIRVILDVFRLMVGNTMDCLELAIRVPPRLATVLEFVDHWGATFDTRAIGC